MIYALIFYIIRTNFLKEICAFSDRIAIRQRIHFRTQYDQKAHKFPSTADIVIYLRILLYYHHNFLKERLRESSKSGIREGIGSGTPRGSFTSVWKRRQNDESQWIVPQRHSQHLQHISLYKSSARCFLCFRCQIGKTHALTDSMDTLSR